MAHSIYTEITIHSTPGRIWSVLMDFPRYAEWNPFIKQISGNPDVGNKLEVIMQPPGGSVMKFTPTVLVCQQNKRFKWIGSMGFKGIFDGEHSFEIRDNGDGSCTFMQSERFSGILVPLFKKMLDGKTKEGFVGMNEGLNKQICKLENMQIS